MTRRLAVAILLVTWATLAAAGGGAYAVARHALLADLDDAIVARAVLLPDVLGVANPPGGATVPPGDRYLIRTPLGQTVARPPAAPPPPAGPVEVVRASTTVLADGSRLRTVTLSIAATAAGGRPLVVTYSTPMARVDRLLNHLAFGLLASGTAAAVLAVAAAGRVARLALLPLTRTARTLETIDEQRLDQRLDAAALPPELRLVADRLNAMLARLESAFAQRRQFLAHASHELRTPVAALVTTIEVALRRPREAASLTETLAVSLGEARTLRHLVEQLTRQARSEPGGWDEPPERVDVAALLATCADAVSPLAADRRVEVRRHLSPLSTETQPMRVRGIVTNLLANAVEYNRPGGHVDLSCDAAAGGLTITVADDGVGIPPDVLPGLFEPFTRGRHPAGSADGHLGLGLSIVRGHCRSLGGRCDVSSAPGRGTTFRVWLPASAAAPALATVGGRM